MTDLQVDILVATPLLAVGSNTALFVHLTEKISSRFASVEARIDMILGKLADLNTRVALLEDSKPARREGLVLISRAAESST